jgi:hypothetical protein
MRCLIRFPDRWRLRETRPAKAQGGRSPPVVGMRREAPEIIRGGMERTDESNAFAQRQTVSRNKRKT